MLKFFVTGGAGFIGSHLCERLLRQGHSVASLDNFNDYYDSALKEKNIRLVESLGKNFRSIRGDIRDKNIPAMLEAEKPDCIVHLAAMVGVRPSLADPLLYEEVNVRGTLNMLEAARAAGVRDFILASSSSVYGNNSKVPFSEEDPVDAPISPYAATKKACELLSHTYAALYGFRITCLRFFTVYGPRQRPDLAIRKFSKLLSEKEPLPFYGDGSTRRDYTFIEDILDGIDGAIRWTREGKPGRYGIFNLGESRTVSLTELIGFLESLLGVKASLERLPDQPGDVQCTFADLAKSKAQLQYAPKVPIEEGLRRFVEWFKSGE